MKRRGPGTRDQGPEKHSWATGPRSLAPGPAVCLTIAGSDSGGGAGIQADLKTFAALGVHGASAITALTAQNTQGVAAVHPVPVKHLRAELDAVFDDFAITAVKTGMLAMPARRAASRANLNAAGRAGSLSIR